METETFQHYRILRREDGSRWELGRGAMAVTYKAFDVNLCCPVALKVVNANGLSDEHTRARFVREARAAAGLRHRNIATVYHLGNDEESYFYAMEFVDGETIEDLVGRRGPLPPAEALAIAAQVARALGAAARQGLVHRDIKPANLMIVRENEEGEGLLVKVIDFGLARRAVTEAAAQITRGGFVGTPQYASPEQVEERDLDSRSDIYSLGVTLWFMLTGQPTFTGPAARIGLQHLHDEPPWKAVAPLPAPVRALLAHALRKNPADRPQDPTALRREIETCLESLAEGAPSSPALPAPPDKDAAGPPAADLAAAETVVPAVPLPAPEGDPPAVGDMLAGRYLLSAGVGEGRAGRVFCAVDARHGGRTVAIKTLTGLDRLGLLALQADFRRLRAAPHPRLIEPLAVDETRGHWFVASEWVNGFTLVDLLRHRGRLELPEALRLLEQASDAAAHGSANGLRHLGLAPHQILIHFPVPFVGDKTNAIREIIDRPLAKWPGFGLKIDALALPRGNGRCPPADGSLTLVPAADDGVGVNGFFASPEGGYQHALSALLYEILSGTPPPSEREGKREAPPLPVLGEETNDLLRDALSARPEFRDERDFFDRLLATCHLERADSLPATGQPPASHPARKADANHAPSPRPLARPPSAVLPMAAKIRTKLLRPPATFPKGKVFSPPANRSRRTGWLVIILVTALVVVALGTGLLYRAIRRPPGTSPQTASP